MWGQQGQCLLTWLQKQAVAADGHHAGRVPWGSELQPRERKGLAGSEEGEPTHPSWDAPTLGCPHPPHPHTHTGNPLGIRHCCGNQACSGHSQRHCCSEDSAGSAPLWRAQAAGLWGFTLLLHWQDQHRLLLGSPPCHDPLTVVHPHTNA